MFLSTRIPIISLFYHPRDNTCEINVIDLIDKKDGKADKFDRSDLPTSESVAGRYISKLR